MASSGGFDENKEKGRVLAPEDHSYSLNSVKVFKEIEELTKINEELKEKSDKYQAMLEHICKFLEKVGENAEISE